MLYAFYFKEIIMKNYLLVLSLLFLSVFSLYAQDLKPTNSKALVTVKVFDAESQPLPKQVIFIKNLKTNEKKKGISNPQGQFKILLPKGAPYSMYFPDYDENQDEASFTLPGGDGLLNVEMKIFEPKIVYKEKYILNVFYETGKAKLLPNSYPYLDSLYGKLKNNPDLKIEIAGHTDNVGSDAYNQQLSQKRANNVKQYLVNKGIKNERVKAKGYGETDPLAENSTEAGRQRNRRTEVRVISK